MQLSVLHYFQVIKKNINSRMRLLIMNDTFVRRRTNWCHIAIIDCVTGGGPTAHTCWPIHCYNSENTGPPMEKLWHAKPGNMKY